MMNSLRNSKLTKIKNSLMKRRADNSFLRSRKERIRKDNSTRKNRE